MASYHLVLVLAVIGLLCVTAVGQGNKIKPPFHPSCSNTSNDTGDSQYKKNLDQLLTNLATTAAGHDWFNTSSVGTGADQVFGLIMCYTDAMECQKCLIQAPAGITMICPGSRTVSAAYGPCLLRYSDVSFAKLDANINYRVFVPTYVENTTSTMNDTRQRLTSQLAESAGDSPVRFDNGPVPCMDSQLGSSLFGLAQCTRDLAARECSTCLNGYDDKLSVHVES